MFEINCDASVSSDGLNVGIGVVVRDSLGNLIMAVGERLGGRQQICAAELLAVLLGLDIAKQNGWSYFMVKSDCLEVVSMVNSNEECFAGVLVEEVRGLLPLYNASGFSHVSRRAHGAAHEVAKKLTF